MSRGGARVWGNAHPAAQLTEKRVIRYRELVRSGRATVGELAAKEGCSHGRISMAVRGETWAHLNDVAPPVSSARRQTAAKVTPTTTARSRTKTATKLATKSGTKLATKLTARPGTKRATKVAAKRGAKTAPKPAARGRAAPAKKAARR